jgi:hypothetical protein
MASRALPPRFGKYEGAGAGRPREVSDVVEVNEPVREREGDAAGPTGVHRDVSAAIAGDRIGQSGDHFGAALGMIGGQPEADQARIPYLPIARIYCLGHGPEKMENLLIGLIGDECADAIEHTDEGYSADRDGRRGAITEVERERDASWWHAIELDRRSRVRPAHGGCDASCAAVHGTALSTTNGTR